MSLPRLTVIPVEEKARKRYHYHLHLSAFERRRALAAGILSEQRKRKISLREAATAKKARLNVLRIYRKYKRQRECLIITRDMMWIDKTYLNKKGYKATTKNICNSK